MESRTLVEGPSDLSRHGYRQDARQKTYETPRVLEEVPTVEMGFGCRHPAMGGSEHLDARPA